ncbi:MAG: tRNA(Leu) C34 or U34 (ribose-2'-O)-methylase TrmL [Alphaproteobacteria bacterium]
MKNNGSRISIGLLNPKSASNVAVILRAAGCFGVSSIFYTGTRYTHAKAFHEDTKKFRDSIPSIAVDDLLAMMPRGATPVVVELVEGAIPLPAFTHPENAYYIFGPEDGSVPQDIVSACEHVIYIPTKSSMNLAVTANVVLYDRLAKSDYEHSNELIKQSRDVNNNAKVKRP